MSIYLVGGIRGILVAIIASRIGLETLSFDWWCFVVAMLVLLAIPNPS